jgi:transposase
MAFRVRMKTFKPDTPDPLLVLPSAVKDWLPEDHQARFIDDVAVHPLDVTPIVPAYEAKDGRGQPPFHPALPVKLRAYGYCLGKPSSRKIERATYEEVPDRVLAANQHPDHDSIAAFRQQHLAVLAGRVTQMLALCRLAGLVQLRRGALDGTKVLANASEHKAMSHGRTGEAERKLEADVAVLLAQAAQVDASEDAQAGKSRRGDALPIEVARRASRLAKNREAKACGQQEIPLPLDGLARTFS